MKSFVVIFLLLIYSFSSIGMTLHFHYCCGKIDKVAIAPIENEDCTAPKHMSKKSCCDNKQLDVKIKSDYQKDSELKSLNKPLLSEPGYDNANFVTAVSRQLIVTGFTDTSPPLHPQDSFLQLYCIYRI